MTNEIEMKQGSEEWLEWRKQGIGASDAPIVMGVSPWCTPYELWLQKKGLKEVKKNWAMQRGQDMEKTARDAFMRQHSLLMTPACMVHKDYGWLRASLDGVSFDGSMILEVKCPGAKDHALAVSGQVPEKYEWQLRHQMLVSGAELAYYWSFDGQEGIAVRVFRDREKEQQLFAKLWDFWHHHILADIAPEITESDSILIDTPEFAQAAQKWREAALALKMAQEQEKTMKAQLIDLSDDGNCYGHGVKLCWVTRRAVDYARMVQDLGIDTEKYMKESSAYLKVTADGKER